MHLTAKLPGRYKDGAISFPDIIKYTIENLIGYRHIHPNKWNFQVHGIGQVGKFPVELVTCHDMNISTFVNKFIDILEIAAASFQNLFPTNGNHFNRL